MNLDELRAAVGRAANIVDDEAIATHRRLLPVKAKLHEADAAILRALAKMLSEAQEGYQNVYSDRVEVDSEHAAYLVGDRPFRRVLILPMTEEGE